MGRDYRAISADSHLEIPGDRWIHRVPETLRGLAPTRVSLPGGGEAHFIEGQPLRVEAERSLKSHDRRLEARSGSWDENDGGGPTGESSHGSVSSCDRFLLSFRARPESPMDSATCRTARQSRVSATSDLVFYFPVCLLR